jgi:hypothetical protein
VLSRLQPVSRDALIDNAGAALSVLISKTRAVVGADVLRGRTELSVALPEPRTSMSKSPCRRCTRRSLPCAERAARELLDAAPFRESGHLLLMRTLAARGNVAEALTAYEHLRVMLRDELGVNPSPAVQEVYTRLLG